MRRAALLLCLAVYLVLFGTHKWAPEAKQPPIPPTKQATSIPTMAAPADGTVAIDVSASDVELSSRSPKPTQPSPAIEAEAEAEVEIAEAAIHDDDGDAGAVAAVAASSAEAGGAGAGAGAGSEGLRKRTSSTGRDEAWVDPLANLRSTRNLTLQPTPGVLLEWNHLSYEVVTQGKRSYANDPTAQEIEPSKCKASCKRACGPLPCGMVHSNTRACVMLCIDKSL